MQRRIKHGIKTILRAIGHPISRLRMDKDLLAAFDDALRKAPNPVIFDVGAHYGETQQVFEDICPTAQIYCFEPFKSSFDILSEHTKNSPFTQIFNFGFSNTKGALDFNSNMADPTNSILDLDERAADTWELETLAPNQKISCDFTTLDDFLEKENIEHIDILKLDVQGAEYKILQGAQKTLDAKIIKNIYMEIIIAPTYQDQWPLERYVELMQKNGYHLHGLFNLCYRKENGRLLQLDAMFTLG